MKVELHRLENGFNEGSNGRDSHDDSVERKRAFRELIRSKGFETQNELVSQLGMKANVFSRSLGQMAENSSKHSELLTSLANILGDRVYEIFLESSVSQKVGSFFDFGQNGYKQIASVGSQSELTRAQLMGNLKEGDSLFVVESEPSPEITSFDENYFIKVVAAAEEGAKVCFLHPTLPKEPEQWQAGGKMLSFKIAQLLAEAVAPKILEGFVESCNNYLTASRKEGECNQKSPKVELFEVDAFSKLFAPSRREVVVISKGCYYVFSEVVSSIGDEDVALLLPASRKRAATVVGELQTLPMDLPPVI